MGNGIFTQANHFFTWLDGRSYPCKESTGHFGRTVETYSGWGELRKQKKSPHTEVLYVLALSTQKDERCLVLRSINNCSNDQLQDAIKLCALRLQEGQITQPAAEAILDRCYAELQRRLEWTDREKEKRRGQFAKDKEEARI